MRLVKGDICDIQYDYKEYGQELFDSVKRIGFSFPIHVVYENGQYRCIDGHKRLSVLHDILKSEQNYRRGSQVCIIIKNSDDVHSNDCWRGRNTH